MRLLGSAACVACWVIMTTEAYTPASTFQTDLLASAARVNQDVHHSFGPGRKCNPRNAAVRRECDRKAYINAVLCLMALPAKTDKSMVPGARSRYDDFVGTHIQQTLSIHGTANFLTWHRYFTWAFEQALRKECGYRGAQPYWNWGKSAFDPLHSPYFDGSETSMSGNGAFEEHNATAALPTGLNSIPPGVGGGCVASGPFKDMKVNLGPVAPTFKVPSVKPNGNGLSYNPRCLRRDITAFPSRGWTKDSDVFALLTRSKNVSAFQTAMQGDFGAGAYGVHTAGHFTYGGDPGGDLFASPGDPMFWLHHAMIDRTFWIWQNLDPDARRKHEIAGTVTIQNVPPSRDGTLEDVITLGGVGVPDVRIDDVVDTMDGPLCYTYA